MPIIKCDYCGKLFYKRPFRIKKEKIHTCSYKCKGLLQKGRKNYAWKDLTGVKKNRLTFLYYLDSEKKWVLKCDCGNIFKRQSAYVLNNNTKSCGCLPREKGKRFHSQKTKRIISLSKIGIKNPNWKGSNVGYASIHEYIKRRKKKPAFCERCRKKAPYDLSSNGHTYTRNPKDWKWLCRSCHMIIDRRKK